MEYNWTIVSKDLTTGAMVVKYEKDGIPISINIPLPQAEENIDEHVAKFAPISSWEQRDFSNVTVGQSGIGQIEAQRPTEIPSTVGNWDEEHIRALIYQVMEEINAAKV